MRLLLILLLSLSLYGSDYEHHSERHINKELSHLHLTTSQKREVKSLLKAFRVELKAYRRYKKRIKRERQELFLQDQFDVDTFNALNRRIDQEAHAIESRFLMKMHKILTERQRVRFIHYFDDWEVK